MKDPYSLLGVARDADLEVIKQAYRKLAKRLHPDRNLNNPTVEQRFKDITQAYNLLSDQETRREYDRGRIEAHGRKRRPPFGQTAAHGQGHGWWPHGVETIFERVIDKFGLNGTGKTSSDQKSPAGKKPPRAAHDRHHKSMRESGQHHRLEVDFLIAVHGGKQRITTADGKTLDIDIPRGTADNTLLRLKGQEHSKEHGEGWGDLLISIRVLDHPLFTRRGRDLCLDLPISLKEALLGAKVRTPTIEGAVRLTIPARANSGQILRLKGKGVVDRHGGRGDQLVRLMVTLPKQLSAAMAADLERLAGHGDYDVRDHFGPP